MHAKPDQFAAAKSIASDRGGAFGWLHSVFKRRGNDRTARDDHDAFLSTDDSEAFGEQGFGAEANEGQRTDYRQVSDGGSGSASPQPLGQVGRGAPGAEGWLVATQLRKGYKGRAVIHDVSLMVRRGEAVALLGPNGAGKTTLFYMITGIVRPDSGAITLENYDVTALPMYRRARLGIGYLPQEPSIFRGLSVEDNIRAVLEITQRDKRKRAAELEALLEEFNIARLRKSMSIALSGGERRRLEIARALAGHPSFMLLDEPFAGVDPLAVADIQGLVHHLKERGIGVLITDHNVRETLGLVDRAYIIHSGHLLSAGTPEEIVADPDARRLYLGEDFRL